MSTQDWKEWISNLSLLKLLAIVFLAMLFFDMVFYYLNALFGRTTPPYPILHEILNMLKEWKFDINSTHAEELIQ